MTYSLISLSVLLCAMLVDCIFSVIVDCGGVGQASCHGLTAYLPQEDSFNVTCGANHYGGSTCVDVNLYAFGAEDSYDDSLLSVQCHNSSDDCPDLYLYHCSNISLADSCIKSRYFARPFDCSNSTTHCQFDCDEIDCTARDFDGSLAQSLTGMLSGDLPV